MSHGRFVALALALAVLLALHVATGDVSGVIEDLAVMALGIAYRRFTLRAIAANQRTIEAADRMIAALERRVGT